MLPSLTRIGYMFVVKPVLFQINPETVHKNISLIGEWLGDKKITKTVLGNHFIIKSPLLKQTLLGINFQNPIGLAAGFDYEARLPHMTPHFGFGFHTVGTITYQPCIGNPKPQLGRLPKSQSLMVNKGFRNSGAIATAKKMAHTSFSIPLGISIGRTNNKHLTLTESTTDILSSFQKFENTHVANAYYELNISCPNLLGGISFYSLKNLSQLLSEIEKLHVKKPVFVKMPISLENKQILSLLNCISKYSPKGIIIGNLQKDRKNPAFDIDEVKKFSVGNFSGKPTFERSNELISLAYHHFSDRYTIIGCGGVFSGEDAYTKIKKGATLIQLITGLVYNGPQLVYEINSRLIDLLQADGFKNIADAIGSDQK